MSSKKRLKDFVKCFQNKSNNQKSLTISSKKLKAFDIKLDDLLNTEIKRKIRRFEDG